MQIAVNDSVLTLPIVALRDIVVFPYMIIPLFIGRDRSVAAFEEALKTKDKRIVLLSQKNIQVEDPGLEDLYPVGTIATVLQLMKLPDGTAKVLIEGIQRGHVLETDSNSLAHVGCIEVNVKPLKTELIQNKVEMKALVKSLLSSFEHYAKLSSKLPPELLDSFHVLDDPVKLVDLIAAHMTFKVADKQDLLATTALKHRFAKLLLLLETEIEVLEVEYKIEINLKKNIEKHHKEHYLHEKIKAYQKELGALLNEQDDPASSPSHIMGGIGDFSSEIQQLKKKLEESYLPKEAYEKVKAEIQKLKMMPPIAAEATVSRNYIDCILSLPWSKKSEDSEAPPIRLEEAETILNQDYYGLENVKERVLEFLAVQKRVKKLNGLILCLVGPPGVGKTCLGQSIAKAVGRKYARIALGGMRDEAEIRGHRRTYIGALPGKVIQKIAKVGVRNPLILLDEIDKIALDFRGDPASALLEVLDPEQNKNFNDHYLEIDYDLSDVMFLTTANSLNMPAPLLDRMEIIRLSGYAEYEKLRIAQDHLIPKQRVSNGLEPTELIFSEESLLEIIRYYTREAGVRGLERELAKICRKVVKELLLVKAKKSKQKSQICINASQDVEKYLGTRKYHYGKAETDDLVGQVTGLAWTEAGGDILRIEAKILTGKGKITSTGKLGEVMQESIQAALTVVRSNYKTLGLNKNFYEQYDAHVHIPEGATPKDGPSAGIAVCTALASALTNRPVHSDLAMTGEITLGGQVLAIGGLKEKLLAARRSGIRTVLIPKDNEKDLKEVPALIKKGLKITSVSNILEVWQRALYK